MDASVFCARFKDIYQLLVANANVLMALPFKELRLSARDFNVSYVNVYSTLSVASRMSEAGSSSVG